MSDPADAIAIIAVAGRFPGADSPEQLWERICAGTELITRPSRAELARQGANPAWLEQPNYVAAGGLIDGIDLFDAPFFTFTPREAERTDPQHRLFLECAWEALERAGYDSETFPGRIGLYAGERANSYLLSHLLQNPGLMQTLGYSQTLIGNDRDFLATQVAYKLNLRGPCFTVQTACSTSLVAVHLACQGLINGECDLALAGGVAINVLLQDGYVYEEGGILSPDGYCRAFDAQAQGTVAGNGLGLVVLKRLEAALDDGDQILAVIRGTAINNDGAHKIGYTAPSIQGQAQVIADALAVADVAPETIGYVETHGTGTPLGDPIEIAALTEAFHSQRRQFCAIGSIKTNLGHLDVAAGIAGLIKATLAIHHGRLPPSLHFTRPNPQIDFANSPFYVNTRLQAWPQGVTPRRAGVSSFGIGGTNAHVVLEEAPPRKEPEPSADAQVLVLSARTPAALERATDRLVEHLRTHPEQRLADVAYTLQVGRRAWPYRRMLVCHGHDDAIEALATNDPARVLTNLVEQPSRPVVFMFPGQGAQYAEMTAELYQAEPTFRAQVDRCAQRLRHYLDFDLQRVLYPGAAAATPHLDQTEIAQPALFVIAYAVARMLMAWGIRPAAMIGHSLGEYVAATLAGVLSLDDALRLVVARGRLMQTLPPGGMLSAALSEQQAQRFIDAEIALAAVNGPALCVFSGTLSAIERLEQQLTVQGIECRRLHTSRAFHSPQMEPIVEPLKAELSQIALKPPKLPYLSNVTGTWITAAEATDPDYWTRHLCQTVRFGAGVEVLAHDPDRLLLEVGPGRTLTTIVRQATGRLVLPTIRHPQDRQSDLTFLRATLGKLWLSGASVSWSAAAAPERRRVLLPTYPFERQRYWLDSQPTEAAREQPGSAAIDAASPPAAPGVQHPRPMLLNSYVAPRNAIEQQICAIWQELFGIDQVGVHDNFFELGGHSLIGTQVIARLRDVFALDLPLRSFYEHATVAELGEIVERLFLEQLEQLPEDQAQDLLARLFQSDD
ncbi:MAG TPA: beta-ketoacyl synthase N-terminal-like domain-containing protein [Herpetosiphonaceae bacterium]